MGLVIVIVFFLILISSIQAFLSFRRNRLYGYIVPLINMIGATLFAMQCSDYFTGYFMMALCMLPICLWFGILYIAKKKMEKDMKQDTDRMKIQDL